VQVLGVDDSFWDLAAAPPPALPAGNGVLLNAVLAARLGVSAGDEIVLRVAPASSMPSDEPLAATASSPVSLRLSVLGTLPPTALSNFSLSVAGSLPLNLFVAREVMATSLGRPRTANEVLLAPVAGVGSAAVRDALAGSFRLEDVGLSLRQVGASWEMVSDRVFVPPAAETAGLSAGGSGLLTYFVDRIARAGGTAHAGRDISYCFVSSGEDGRVPADLRDDEIVLNRWAADALGAGVGDVVETSYRVPGPEPADPLEQRATTFRVRAVVPIQPADRTLMPDFPGFRGVQDCRRWDPGVPLDLSRITAADQSYWDTWGGSPKGFVTLATAQRLWANRFGRLTAVRFRDTAPTPEAALAAALSPEAFGLAVAPVAEIARAASVHGVDFGQLFLGLSCFLVAAALLLVFLLVRLGMERRTEEIGTLSALGFSRGLIARLCLWEGIIVAVLGAGAGVLLGLASLRGIVAGLGGAWRDAVAAAALQPAISAESLVLGAGCALAVSAVVIVVAVRRALALPTAGLLRGSTTAGRHAVVPAAAVVAACSVVAAAAAAVFLPSPTSFFAAGVLLLAACCAASALFLRERPPRAGKIPTVAGLGAAMSARRRTRSIAVSALLACGLFIVTSIGVNRPSLADPSRRESGSGGFDLVAETSLPVSAEREKRLAPALPAGTLLVGMRVRAGDDASCLNLNRAAQPRLVGVAPDALAGRFSFSGTRLPEDPWKLLDADLGTRIVPAIADATVMTWSLGVKVGDELPYTAEDGTSVRLRLVAALDRSVFQGSLVVSEEAMARWFPSAAGHLLFVVESPRGQAAAVRTGLEGALGSLGAWTEPAAERLARFDRVEIAYLAIFSFLGWLGMLLGAVGLGVVVVRNIEESRGELAILRAVGLPHKRILSIVVAENALPAAFGVAAGIVSSAAAVIPAALTAPGAIDLGPLAAQAAAIAGVGLACIILASLRALGSSILPALRRD
jgi:hypothetical protein